MHHRMPPSKIWVAQFKRGDFSTCDAPRPGWPKTVTTPEIIDQIHELILEDRQILAKSIAEQLGISREQVGSIIHEDLNMRKFSAKWVPKCLNADQKRQRCQSSEQFWTFLARSKWFPVAIGDHGRNLVISLWPGDKATIIGVATLLLTPPQKIPSANIRRKISHLDFLGWRRHPPHWLSSKWPNYQRGVLLIFAGALEGHFEGKMPWEGHQECLVLARRCPGSPGTCNPEETGPPGLPVSWSPTLFFGSGPVRLPPVPWTEKSNWKFAVFRSTWSLLLPWRPGWMDNILIFFEWLAKVRAMG